MKHLLTGVAIAAAVAISAPAWAQNAPMKPAAPAAAAPAPAAKKPMMHKAMMHHAMMHHGMRHHHMAMHSDDAMTEQLNNQELARIQGGGGAMSGPAADRLPGPKVGPK